MRIFLLAALLIGDFGWLLGLFGTSASQPGRSSKPEYLCLNRAGEAGVKFLCLNIKV
ncbi:hypothetical protein QT972_11710 [Microcoleus sp. herbarium7]|uniref:hypothetical protein n=1 Tax=Microcoleus sp. herbarium7 TaxID=3055435 RepID=UPI002FD38D98